MRCRSCGGLATHDSRHVTRVDRLCSECRRGRVVPVGQFHNYWLERFTMDEIRELAGAIWG